MDEVVEISVGAMHLMAKDMSSRQKMKQTLFFAKAF